MSQGSYDDAYKKVEPIYIGEKQYDYFNEIYPKIYKPYRNIQLENELKKLEKIVNEENEGDFKNIYEKIYEELESKSKIHKLRSDLYSKLLKKDFNSLDNFAKGLKEDEFLQLETSMISKLSLFEESINFINNSPENSGKKIESDLNKDKLKKVKLLLYTNIFNNNLKNLDNFARLGKKDEFLAEEITINKLKDKINPLTDSFTGYEKITASKKLMYDTYFSSMFRKAESVFASAGTNSAKFEEVQVILNDILKEAPDNEKALKLKEKNDKILSYFNMSDTELTESLVIKDSGCYAYNHPFTMYVCYTTVNNPTPRKAKNIKVRWHHISRSEEVVDTTDRDFYDIIPPYSSKKFSKDDIFSTGETDGKVKDKAEVRSAMWE